MTAPDIDLLEKESAEVEGYFSDTPLNPKPKYPELKKTFDTSIIILNLPKVGFFSYTLYIDTHTSVSSFFIHSIQYNNIIGSRDQVG